MNTKPFGEAEVVINEVKNNSRFPGQYFDEETELHYNYFRDYDPSLGRYLQSDPIGLAGGINIYVYGKNNPVVLFDLYGLFPSCDDSDCEKECTRGYNRDSQKCRGIRNAKIRAICWATAAAVYAACLAGC